MKSYGIINQSVKDISPIAENIRRKGFAVLEQVIDVHTCKTWSEGLEKVYQKQLNDFGIENLISIKEENIVRMPFLEDWQFNELFMYPKVIEIVRELLGDNFQLHLQNAVLNRPNKEHHQSSWHRDLPYQNWTSSEPLGINAFFCLTDFNSKTGATSLLPFSHKMDSIPSESYFLENKVQIEAKAGSILFFDSMLFHCAEYNASNHTRVGVNNMFVRPFISQQIDIVKAVKNSLIEPTENQKKVLGFHYSLATNVKEYRHRRLMKQQS